MIRIFLVFSVFKISVIEIYESKVLKHSMLGLRSFGGHTNLQFSLTFIFLLIHQTLASVWSLRLLLSIIYDSITYHMLEYCMDQLENISMSVVSIFVYSEYKSAISSLFFAYHRFQRVQKSKLPGRNKSPNFFSQLIT